jgi:hypothetical protein
MPCRSGPKGAQRPVRTLSPDLQGIWQLTGQRGTALCKSTNHIVSASRYKIPTVQIETMAAA